jgi:hypothetical protein
MIESLNIIFNKTAKAIPQKRHKGLKNPKSSSYFKKMTKTNATKFNSTTDRCCKGVERKSEGN